MVASQGRLGLIDSRLACLFRRFRPEGAAASPLGAVLLGLGSRPSRDDRRMPRGGDHLVIRSSGGRAV